MTDGKVIFRGPLPGERQEIPPPEADEEFTWAVVDVAREMDASRHWRERAADIVRSVRLFLAIIRSHRR